MVLQRRTPASRITSTAIDLLSQPVDRWQALYEFYNSKLVRQTCKGEKVSHWGSFQSRPAGQRSAPVTGWLKPRFVLTLRESGGFNGLSRGAIQSSTTPLRLLVSSDLALDMPF